MHKYTCIILESIIQTRMHSSRMHTTHSSSHPGDRVLHNPPSPPLGTRHPPGTRNQAHTPPPWTEFFTHACENITVMGWQESDFTSKCLFLLFWLISSISLIFLIEIWSFCTNLLENYPLHKIDQLPLLRILSLCMDHSMQTRIISLYLFLLFLFTPLALFGQNDIRIDALVWQ